MAATVITACTRRNETPQGWPGKSDASEYKILNGVSHVSGTNFLAFNFDKEAHETSFYVAADSDSAFVTLELELTRSNMELAGDFGHVGAVIMGEQDGHTVEIKLGGDSAFAAQCAQGRPGERFTFVYTGKAELATLDSINGKKCWLGLTW